MYIVLTVFSVLVTNRVIAKAPGLIIRPRTVTGSPEGNDGGFSKKSGTGSSSPEGLNVPMVTPIDTYGGIYAVSAGRTTGSSSFSFRTANDHSPPIIDVQPTPTNTICNANPIILSVTASGTEPLKYQWESSGSVTGKYKPISDATSSSYKVSATQRYSPTTYYKVIVTNDGGRETSDVAAVTVSTLPADASPISGSSTLCDGQTDVEFSIPSIPNATSYTWFYSGSGAIISGTTNFITVNFTPESSSGTLTVAGHNTCGDGAAAILHIKVNTTPAAPATTITQPTCVTATGTITVTVQHAGESYSFDNGSTFQASNVKSGLPAGTYHVIIRSSGGCNSGATATIVKVQPVTPASPATSVTQPTCANATGTITVTAQHSGDTYSYDNGTTFQAGNTKSGLPAGKYNVIIRSSGGCNSEATAATVNIQPSTPTAPATLVIQPTCFRATGSITVTTQQAGETYSFDNGITFQSSNTKSGLSSGIYYVIIRSSGGCNSSTTAATVNIQPATPAVPATAVIQPTCTSATGSIMVAVQHAGDIYSFDNGITFGASNTKSGLPAGKYNVIIRSSGGCNSDATEITVNLPPETPTIPVILIAQPTCSTATGTITITVQHAGETYSYDNGLTFQSSNTKSGLSAGIYHVIIRSSGGCNSSATAATINIQPATPAAPATAVIQPTCTSATGSITVTVQHGGETYSFDNGITFQAINTKSGLLAGKYNVIIRSSGGCNSDATETTVNLPPETPTIPVILITQPTCSTATGTITITVQHAGETYSYDNGLTFQAVNIKSGMTSGTYGVIIKSTDGCTSSVTAATVNASRCTDLSVNKSVDLSTPNVGSNVTFTLKVINNGPDAASGVLVTDLLPDGYTYISDNGTGYYASGSGIWTIGALTNSATATLSIKATVNASGNYTNTASITGKESDPTAGNNKSSVTIDPNHAPDANDDIDTTEFETTSIINILGNDSDPENGALTFTICSNPHHGTAVINIEGTITYTPYSGYSGSDSICYTLCDTGIPELCDESMVYIEVLPVATPDNLIISRTLTPNGDGRNDVWAIGGIEKFPDNKVTIFNRWGDKIYEGAHYDNTNVSWNGTYRNNVVLPDGTYYYILEIKGTRTVKGWIYITESN